ncbi:hypothetical protein SELMODRAFT_430353 [Selaginella moellendorffii]|uniref:Nramp family protein n=1 Tax=Selaginella moellendorffii TaxID=88036 RepID=D8T952_SELML|nr:hypothetical protein SELMODRAFT_430353 [Selaginella moellendorffii]
MGLLIQLLAARLGVATGSHLAELCREEYPSSTKIVLWIMTEVAIIGADIQEVIGSAIAFKILSRGYIHLWAGVLMTGIYGFLFLFLENFGVRKLEALFAVLILIMGLSFAGVFGEAQPSSNAIISGLVIPRVPANAIDKAVGIVGCVIMPHNIFLHSALVQSRAIDTSNKVHVRDALRYYSIESTIAIVISFLINVFIMSVFAKSFYGKPGAQHIGLANAGEYLQHAYGGSNFPIKYIWAAGLLAAGQSSTMTSTYTGQFVMAGFLNLRIRKWIRVMVTRSVAIVPTIIVALAFDSSDNELDQLNEWLNVLQSIQLPFALIPLLTFVDNERIMGSFRIGGLLKAAAGLIALLVVVINFYLLAVFLLHSAIRSILILLLVGILICLYAAFIVYLVALPFMNSRSWAALSSSFHKYGLMPCLSFSFECCRGDPCPSFAAGIGVRFKTAAQIRKPLTLETYL